MSSAGNVSGSVGGSASQSGAAPKTEKPPLPLSQQGEMPALEEAADQASIASRAAFFTWLRAELVLLILAAIAALFTALPGPEIALGPFDLKNWPAPAATIVASIHGLSYAGIATAVFALGALLVRVYRNNKRFESAWYEERAVAESVKSIAWRYATGGRPFPLGGDEAEIDQLFRERLDDALFDVAHDLRKSEFTDEQKITPALRMLRGSSLTARQTAYRDGRINEQARWYQNKVGKLATTSRKWHQALFAIELLSFIGAIALAFKLIPFNIQSAVTAVASAIISWTQAQRYRDLEASYEVTGSELSSIGEKIAKQSTEDVWSTFVDEAEEACSREHRLWRATRDKDPKEA